jgi:tRNA (guanosine-2'-O-)-methyltransferase
MPTSADTVRFDALTPEQADQVVAHLTEYVSESRRERVEVALAARTRDVAVVLEDIFSEHNASAVLRTSEAFGVLEVHTVPRAVQFRLSRRVSLGSHRWVDLHRHPDADTAYAALRARGFRIWAADVHGDPRPLEEVPVDAPVALVFGNEHEGLTRQAVEAADGIFKVPMTGFVESLNISVAAAVSVYDVLARRRARGLLRGLEPAELRQLRAAWYAMSVRAAPGLLARAGLPCPVMVVEGAG